MIIGLPSTARLPAVCLDTVVSLALPSSKVVPTVSLVPTNKAFARPIPPVVLKEPVDALVESVASAEVIKPAVTFNALFAVAPPLAVRLSATLVDVVPVRVFEIVAPFVVMLEVVFAPVAAMFNRIGEPDDGPFPDIAKSSSLPEVSVEDVRWTPVPVVNELSGIYT